MYPDAVYQPERESKHEEEGAAVRNERKRHSSNGHEGDRHADVLIDVEENLSGKAGDNDESKLVGRLLRSDQARDQERTEERDNEDATNEAPLLRDRRKNVIGMNRSIGNQPLLHLRTLGFESLAGHAPGTDSNERLADRPTGIERIDLRIDERDDAIPLVPFQAEIDHERHCADPEKEDDNEIAFRDICHEEHGEDDRHPDDAHAEIWLLQNEQHRSADDGTDAHELHERVHLPKLTEKKADHEDAGNHRQLRWLKSADTGDQQPALRAAMRLSHTGVGEDDQRDAGKIHGEYDPLHPFVVDEAHDEEDRDGESHPSDLLVPVVVRSKIGGAVDGDDPQNRKYDKEGK